MCVQQFTDRKMKNQYDKSHGLYNSGNGGKFRFLTMLTDYRSEYICQNEIIAQVSEKWITRLARDNEMRQLMHT